MDLLNIPNDEVILQLAKDFSGATPVPHISLDAMLDNYAEISNSFPGPDWPHWQGLGDSYQRNKVSCRKSELFPTAIYNLISELNSPRCLSFLESLTGIKKLIPDPYLEGGGLHLSTAGGVLEPHTDFHIYQRLNLYRRVNLILYLNDDWTKGDGGELRLWKKSDQTKDRPEIEIEPIGGKMVIFETSDQSVHGFTNPVRNERRSIAIYYYTSEDSSVFSGDYTTHWNVEMQKSGLVGLRNFLYRFLLQTSRAFSFAAHLVNPRQGLKWWKVRSKQRDF